MKKDLITYLGKLWEIFPEFEELRAFERFDVVRLNETKEEWMVEHTHSSIRFICKANTDDILKELAKSHMLNDWYV